MLSEARPSTRSRAADAAPTVRPPCDLHATLIISEKAILKGSHRITIGANTVLHPYAKLDATHGPVTIGQYCIIDEHAIIGIQSHESDHNTNGVMIDDYVNVGVRANIEASTLGKGTAIQACASCERDSIVGSFCDIQASESISAKDTLPDFTVVYGSGLRRIDLTTKDQDSVRDRKLKGQVMHTELLRRLIPSNVAKWQV